MQPLYFSHGAGFCRRQQAALEYPDYLVDSDQRDAYLSVLRQTEHQTLAQMYKPKLKAKSAKALDFSSPQIATFMKELNSRRKGFQDTGNAVHGSALQEVEQEREVAFEVEAVREVQKPIHYSPLSFSALHKDIIGFVKTGRLAAGSGGYEHAFVALGRTTLGLKHRISSEATNSKFFVSKEFARTVKMPLGRTDDRFLVSWQLRFISSFASAYCGPFQDCELTPFLQRQVSWILWSTITQTALVIIPEEAEICLPMLRDGVEPLTHLLAYSAPVTRKMLYFSTLTYYAVPALPLGWKAPAWLTTELGIFAGRLYFDFDEYSHLKMYLGFRETGTKPSDGKDDSLASTEFQEKAMEDREAAGDQHKNTSAQEVRSFTAKPLTFLQEWLAVRRKGQDFTHTPMGYVCQSKPLTESHPFFAPPEKNVAARNNHAAGVTSNRRREENEGGSADNSVTSDQDSCEDNGYFDEGEDEDGMLGECEDDDEDDFVSDDGSD
jgi:hypothetical protein